MIDPNKIAQAKRIRENIFPHHPDAPYQAAILDLLIDVAEAVNTLSETTPVVSYETDSLGAILRKQTP